MDSGVLRIRLIRGPMLPGSRKEFKRCCRSLEHATADSSENLIETAKKLLEYAQTYGSLHRFFADLSNKKEGNPIYLVQAIGSPRSMHKLPALGIPIAAEAMKNIGYDVAKPDRHINRTMGCFKLAQFSNWRDSSDRKPPPLATEREPITVMQVAARFAEVVGVRVSFLDNAIWLLCAKSGLYFSNDSLRELARG